MTKKLKSETPRQAQAFAYYLGLGTERRNCKEVAKKFHVSHTSVNNWAKKFNWHDRVAIADQKISDKIEEKAIKLICEDKDRLNAIKSGILNKIETDIKTILKTETIVDPSKLKAFYEMVKTELGEPSSISSNSVKVEDTENPFANILNFFIQNNAKK